MSVVAVKINKKEIIIGADSIRVSGWTQEKDKRAKLVKLKDMIIGQTGKCKDLGLLQVFVQEHRIVKANEERILSFIAEFIRWCKDKESTYKLESSFFIIFEKKVFLVAADLFIKEIKDFYAIGAGRDFALAALHLGKSVNEAIEVACELSIYCEKPVNIIKVTR